MNELRQRITSLDCRKPRRAVWVEHSAEDIIDIEYRRLAQVSACNSRDRLDAL